MRDRLAALATCRSWRNAARAPDAAMWGALDAARAETPAQAAARRSAHGLLHRGPGPTSAATLTGLASLLAAARPSTASLVGVYAAHPAAVAPLLTAAAPGLTTLSLRLDAVQPAALDGLVRKLKEVGRCLTALELVLGVRDPLTGAATVVPTAGGGQVAAGDPPPTTPPTRPTTRPAKTLGVPPPQWEMGVALSRLAGATPHLTRLVLDAPRGGWAAGPLLASLPSLADATLRGLPSMPGLFTGGHTRLPGRGASPHLTALTSLTLVGCRGLALPAGALCGVPLVRLRIWHCVPVGLDAAAPTEEERAAAAAAAAAAAMAAALQARQALQRLERLVNRGGRLSLPTPPQPPPPPSVVEAWRGAAQQVWEDRDLENPEYLEAETNTYTYGRVPWAAGLADVVPTLLDLELVATPRPTDLAATIAPALTRLSRLVVDTGSLEGESLWGAPPNGGGQPPLQHQSVVTVAAEMALMAALAEEACEANEENEPETDDLSNLLGASATLQTLVLCGTGAYFSWGQGAALGRAAALKTLDLRGCHNHRWPPQAVFVACPALADLLLGFNGRCVEGAGEEFELEHCQFNLDMPPQSKSLTRLVLQNASFAMWVDEDGDGGGPAAWAADFALHLPALAIFHVDDCSGGWVSAHVYRALSFVDIAYGRARRSSRARVLALVRDGHPFSVDDCSDLVDESDDWHVETDEDDLDELAEVMEIAHLWDGEGLHRPSARDDEGVGGEGGPASSPSSEWTDASEDEIIHARGRPPRDPHAPDRQACDEEGSDVCTNLARRRRRLGRARRLPCPPSVMHRLSDGDAVGDPFCGSRAVRGRLGGEGLG